MALITTPIPDINGAKSTEEKIAMLTDAYFMLRKEIEYGMQNISIENFSSDFNKRLTDDKGNIAELILTAELFSTRLSDAEGNITAISQTATAIELRVANNEGSISTLTQTATSLSTRVSDAEGNISTLVQTSNTLTTRISNAEGNISTVTQTASTLSTRLTTAEGNISTVTQTANGLTTRVSSAEGNITTIKQTTDSIALAVNNAKLLFDTSGLTIKNSGFKIMSGTSQIFGISTGGIIELGGGKFTVYNAPGSTYEAFKVTADGQALTRDLYVAGSGTTGATLNTTSYILRARSGVGGDVTIGMDSGYQYYKFMSSPGSYNSYHTFRGSLDLGGSSDTVKIKGFAVKWDANGHLVKE